MKFKNRLKTKVHSVELSCNETLDPKQKQLIKNNPFERKNVFLVVLRFVGPAIIVSLFQALYIFADQIMIIKFVPQSDLNPTSIFFSLGQQYISEQVSFAQGPATDIFGQVDSTLYKQYLDLFLPGQAMAGQTPLNVVDVVRAAVSISAPITVILNGLTVFISMGISVSYAKALARNDSKELQKVWSTGFMTNLTIGLVTSMFILGMSVPWLQQSAIGGIGSHNQAPMDPNSAQGIAHRFSAEIFQKLQIRYAQGYVFILCGFNIIQIFVQMYYLLSQSEGRQLFISIIPPIANGINVLLDWVFIRYANLGLDGSAIATVIGWFLNFAAYFIFSWIMSAKELSHLDVRKLRFKLYTWSYFSIIVLVGIASLMRNSSLALSNALFQTYLVSVTVHTNPQVGNAPVAQNYYQSLYGSVTPITNLALQSVWGVIQGGRAVCAYKYGKKDYAAIKQVYWYCAMLSLVYGVVVYLIFSYGIADPMLTGLFNVQANRDLIEAHRVLEISMVQAIFIAIGTTAQLYFQSTQRVSMSWISSIMQGLLTFVPLLFIFNAAALAYGGTFGMNIFIWLQTANAIISGMLNLLIGTIHLYFFMGKRERLIEQGLKKQNRFVAR
ncbi:MATE family efflux transporter [[Mycoplasma] testudinis]|uniref:MATE family efflux transporter n=1 Tax=[Mycoplasma] testudinis TaxID=33924 RepID=UPI00069779F9|nr:MATE family efflux transporter [[Mycoplasma] testudinis]